MYVVLKLNPLDNYEGSDIPNRPKLIKGTPEYEAVKDQLDADLDAYREQKGFDADAKPDQVFAVTAVKPQGRAGLYFNTEDMEFSNLSPKVEQREEFYHDTTVPPLSGGLLSKYAQMTAVRLPSSAGKATPLQYARRCDGLKMVDDEVIDSQEDKTEFEQVSAIISEGLATGHSVLKMVDEPGVGPNVVAAKSVKSTTSKPDTVSAVEPMSKAEEQRSRRLETVAFMYYRMHASYGVKSISDRKVAIKNARVRWPSLSPEAKAPYMKLALENHEQKQRLEKFFHTTKFQ